MAQQEPYGNWLGPPGIYSMPSPMPPLGDFRPASPDSFEGDYDDVSMAGSERGPRPKGVYLLAGPPGSDPKLGNSELKIGNSELKLGISDREFGISERKFRNCEQEFRNSEQKFGNSELKLGISDREFGNSEPKFGNLERKFRISEPKFGNSEQEFGNYEREFRISEQEFRISEQKFGISDGKFGNSDGKPGNSRGTLRPRAVLAALALLGLGWGALLGTGIHKSRELRAELELLRGNLSGIWEWVQQDQTRLHFGIRQQQLEQQELAAQLCRALGSAQPCSPGWLQHRSRCFSFSRDALSWGRAHNACADLGAQLAVVSDEDEQAFLLEHSNRSSSYWLGLRDPEHSGKWRWVTGEEPKFIFWDAWLREEQRGLRGCGALGPQGRWVRAACAERRRWICQRPGRC